MRVLARPDKFGRFVSLIAYLPKDRTDARLQARIGEFLPNPPLTRDQLLNLTQGREAELFDRSIDLLVSRLRGRLKDDAREPAYIKTVRSEGYVFAMPITVAAPRE